MFDLLQDAKNQSESNDQLEAIQAALIDGLYSDDVIVNEDVVNYFQRTLSAIKNKTQEINPESLANMMAGLNVLGRPEAADVITAADLKQAGCCHNVTDPATLATFEEEEDVRNSVATIGRTYGRKDSPQYAELVKMAQQSGELKELADVMKTILRSHRRPTVGIKQTMDQNRVQESLESRQTAIENQIATFSKDWEHIVHEAGDEDARIEFKKLVELGKKIGALVPSKFPDGSPIK